jgi:hypothetical protein
VGFEVLQILLKNKNMISKTLRNMWVMMSFQSFTSFIINMYSTIGRSWEHQSHLLGQTTGGCGLLISFPSMMPFWYYVALS